jgi:hypothetical protein
MVITLVPSIGDAPAAGPAVNRARARTVGERPGGLRREVRTQPDSGAVILVPNFASFSLHNLQQPGHN